MTPAKRRKYGSGGITQRADGLYVGRVYTGRLTASGERERLTRSGKSRAIVEGKLRELIREIDKKGPPKPGLARVTVKTWADEWLPRHAKKVRPTTYTTDAGAIRRWIIPTIGHRRLADVTPADMRAVVDAITAPDPPRYPKGRSSTTALHAHKLLERMLRAARREGHQIDERLFDLERPTKARNDRTAMTVEELLRVLEVIGHRPDRSRWLAAILTGGRQAETLGLTWACLDLDLRRLDVSWQLQPVPYAVKRDPSSGFRVPDDFEAKHLVGALHLTRPKTAAGERTIPVVRHLVTALTEAREQWTPNPWDLVWTDTLENGEPRPIRDDVDRARWHEIQADAGVAHPSGRPYHVHETRHSMVSLLLADGVDRSVIEAIVGQATLVEAYVHVPVEVAAAALDRFAGRLQLGQP
jgi:integrase